MTITGEAEAGDRITVVIRGHPMEVRATHVWPDEVSWQAVSSRDEGTITRRQWERAAKAQLAVASSKATGPHDLQEVEKYYVALRDIAALTTNVGLLESIQHNFATNIIKDCATDLRRIRTIVQELFTTAVPPERPS